MAGPPSSGGRLPCAFDTALLAGCAGCRLAEQTPVGEQILVYCREQQPSDRCRDLLEQLRQNAGFTLFRARESAPMTHGQAMRLRCGGLRGLAEGIADNEAIADVAGLVDRLAAAPGGFERVDWSGVMRVISAWRPPVRRGRG